MRHIPTQREKVKAWHVLQHEFLPEKAARLLGSSKRQMLALDVVEFPRRLKIGHKERVELVKELLEMTGCQKPSQWPPSQDENRMSGNQAAAALGKSHSWFCRWVPKYIREGEESLKTVHELRQETRRTI
jgi:hypothetical protein